MNRAMPVTAVDDCLCQPVARDLFSSISACSAQAGNRMSMLGPSCSQPVAAPTLCDGPRVVAPDAWHEHFALDDLKGRSETHFRPDQMGLTHLGLKHVREVLGFAPLHKPPLPINVWRLLMELGATERSFCQHIIPHFHGTSVFMCITLGCKPSAPTASLPDAPA